MSIPIPIKGGLLSMLVLGSCILFYIEMHIIGMFVMLFSGKLYADFFPIRPNQNKNKMAFILAILFYLFLLFTSSATNYPEPLGAALYGGFWVAISILIISDVKQLQDLDKSDSFKD